MITMMNAFKDKAK